MHAAPASRPAHLLPLLLLLLQPQQVLYVGVVHTGAQLDLHPDARRAAVHDEIHFVVAVARAQVTERVLAYLRVGLEGEGNESLEQAAEDSTGLRTDHCAPRGVDHIVITQLQQSRRERRVRKEMLGRAPQASELRPDR